MVHKMKLVFNWTGFVIFLFMFLGFVQTDTLASIFFLSLSILVCPPLMSLLEKRNKKPKTSVRVVIGSGLFLIAMLLSPKTETENLPVSDNTAVAKQEDNSGTDKTDHSGTTKTDNTDTTRADNSGNAEAERTEDLQATDQKIESKTASSEQVSEMLVHFIDVGQGDSILIEADGKFMLIDAGEDNQSSTVVAYLLKQGVKKLDYVIATHPHSDHIGGLDTVIRSFEIGKVILPNIEHSTNEYDELITAIEDRNVKITKPVVGKSFQIGSAVFTILSPNGTGYEDLNDYSVGIKLTNQNDTFLLTGDAEELVEKEIINSGIDLSADVLKLGHHGSKYSSSDLFLDKVDPKYAVISAGIDNQYDHPHTETLRAMAERNIKVYRTDKQGTIVFTSDGEHITINKEAYELTASDLTDTTQSEKPKSASTQKATSNPPLSSTDSEIIVHITDTGSKYHNVGCRFLNDRDIEVSLEEAISQALEPCKICKPPVK